MPTSVALGRLGVTLAVSGSRPQRTPIAYVDGPNEGPAEMVIIGGYR